MQTAVVGHVEWVEFARVERVPLPGEIVQASESWAEAAGGGGVASVQLAELAGACTLFTALGRDDARGSVVGAAHRPRGARRGRAPCRAATARVHLRGRTRRADDHDHRREARSARQRPASVAGARGDRCGVLRQRGRRGACGRHGRPASSWRRPGRCPSSQEAGVELDALVRSAGDPSERYERGRPRTPAEARRGDRRTRRRHVGHRRLPRRRLPAGAATRCRSRTPTAPATASRPASRTLSAAPTRPRPPSRFAAECAAAALTRRGAHGR